MKWFQDLRTTTKLAIGFGLVSVLLATVAMLGFSNAATSHTDLEALYERDMRMLNDVRAADSGVLRIMTEARDLATEKDAGERARISREILKLEGDVKKALVDLGGALDGGGSKQDLAVLDADFDRLMSTLAQEEDEGANGVVSDLTLDAAETIGARMDLALDTLGDATVQDSKRAFDANKLAFEKSRRNMILAVAGVVLFAAWFTIFIGRVIARPLSESVKVLERVAGGDLTARLQIDRRDEVGTMASALNRSLDAIGHTLEEVQGVSSEVASASRQLAAAAEQISSGAQEQASGLEQTAASLEEIGATVKLNSENAEHASGLATGARDAAVRGGKVVDSAVHAMAEIIESSKKIADIVTTIDEIAFQTNLLALNAAVEAARAGEQGRGFGVVASEVRNLSQRTAAAAKEIRGLIAESSSRVETGRSQVHQSGATLGEIVQSIQRVTETVAEIASASKEQNAGVAQVNMAVGQIDHVTQSNASQTEELSATAESLSAKADQLQRLVDAFQLSSVISPASVVVAAPPPQPPVARPRAVSAPKPRAPKALTLHREAAPLAGSAMLNGYEEF